MVSTSALLLTVGTWLVADDAAGGGATGALYASVSAVAVALIGGVVAIVTNRRGAPAPEPPANVWSIGMSDLYAHNLAKLESTERERDTLRIERDLWRRRAVRAGWDEVEDDGL